MNINKKAPIIMQIKQMKNTRQNEKQQKKADEY